MSSVQANKVVNPFECCDLLLNYRIENCQDAEQKKLKKAAKRVEEFKSLSLKIIAVIEKISRLDTIRNGPMPADKLKLKNFLQELESNTRTCLQNSKELAIQDGSGKDQIKDGYKKSLKDLYHKVKAITENALHDLPSCKDINKVEKLFEDSCGRIFALREELKNP